jgi:predicted nucleotidyltransferase
MIADAGLLPKTREAIRGVLSHHPEIEKAVLFGSRAKGTHKPGSDVDLALFGDRLSQKTLHRLYQELDDLPVPHEFSLVIFNEITDPAVAQHIQRVGQPFYEKPA